MLIFHFSDTIIRILELIKQVNCFKCNFLKMYLSSKEKLITKTVEKSMINKLLSIILCVFLLTANTSFIYAQTQIGRNDSSTAKIKSKIIKRGKSGNNRANIRLTDGKKLNGYVSQTAEDSFSLTDAKTGQKTTILYADVARVSGGLPNGVKTGIIAGAAAPGVILLISVYKLYNH